jgi:hypothetical protein
MIRKLWESYIDRREDNLDREIEEYAEGHTNPRQLQTQHDRLEQEIVYFQAILPEGRNECSICSIS